MKVFAVQLFYCTALVQAFAYFVHRSMLIGKCRLIKPYKRMLPLFSLF